MDQIEAMKAFLGVVDAPGFAGAARQMGVSTATVTRQVAALEQHLGARLLIRTTRSLRLTDAGQRYLADARGILQALSDADALARGAHIEPVGTLRVTAPVVFGRLHLLPVVLSFLKAHARVSVQTHFVDHVTHLIDEGLDVALRIGRLPDSSLRALPLGSVRPVIVASPGYLRRHGVPRKPDDIERHQVIGLDRIGHPFQPWVLRSEPRAKGGAGEGDGGAKQASDVPCRAVAMPPVRLMVNHNEVVRDAAEAGAGLARMQSYQVAQAVADGRLRIVMADWEPPASPVHLVHADARAATAKVSAFVAHAAPRLRQVLQALDAQLASPTPSIDRD